MNAPLPVTRFAPPRVRAEAIARDDLLARLAGLQRCRLVMFSAAAGYGKTIAMAQWRQVLLGAGGTVVWLSATRGADTPARFCAALAAALKAADLPVAADIRQLLDDEPDCVPEALVPVLVNAIASHDGMVHVMVDDFHRAGSAPVHGLVQALLDEAPANLVVALASRTRPTLRLGRLHAIGECTEIDAHALAFDAAETTAFLEQQLGTEAALALARGAQASTEGWPAGLQCLATAAKAVIAAGLPPATALQACRELDAYFAEEVIAAVPAELVALLEPLSLPPHFDDGLAAHLTGNGDAAALLRLAFAKNLYLLPEAADNGRQWLRLHPLFAAFLRRRLEAAGADIPALHGAAAQWFEQEGCALEALQHATRTGALADAVGVLRRLPPDRANLSVVRKLRRWLADLPHDQLAAHPDILMRGAFACVLAQLPDQAQRCLDVIAAAPPRPGWDQLTGALRAAVALLRDDVPGCLAALPAEVPTTWPPRLRLLHAAMTVSCLSRQGRFDEASRHFHGAATQDAVASDDELAGIATVTAAYAQYYEGHLREAQRMASETLSRIPAAQRARSLAACQARALLVELFYERDYPDTAHALFQESSDLLRIGLPTAMVSVAQTRARLLHLHGEPERALDGLAHVEAACRRAGLARGTAAMLAEQVRLLLMAGDLRRCEGRMHALQALAADSGATGPSQDEISYLCTLAGARFATALQRPDEGLRCADAARRLARQYGRGPWLQMAGLARAVALDALGCHAEALAAARDVLSAARRMGLVRSLCDEGEVWRSLASRLQCGDDAALESYRVRIAAASPAVARCTAPSGASPDVFPELPGLTPRERQVLALVSQGMPNKRIAQALGLSLDTIKWNLKNVFCKLGVSSRYEAVLAAQQMQAPSTD